MAEDSDLNQIMSELVLSKEQFADYKNEELITYCMLLDTIGDHEAMLNCASVHVKKTCSGGPPLRPQEEVNQRDMFAVACKKYITSRLEMWRVLREKRANIEDNSLGRRKVVICEYLADFEKKLLLHITEILEIVDTKLIPNCQLDENRVFYYKMLADYYRYSIDFHGQDADSKYMEAVSEALAHYKYAMELGKNNLDPTNPIFLALVLNYSVFIYDMQNNVVGAIVCAENAFNEAMEGVSNLSEEQHKESTLILQLLRDNLQLWKHVVAKDNGEDYNDPGLTQEDPEVEDED